MAKAKTLTRKPESMKVVRGNVSNRVEQPAATFASLYVNDVIVMMTPWDFRLRLSQLESVDLEKGEAVVTVHADVRMSPQHLKKLVQVLTKQLEIYEGAIGAIPEPPEGTVAE
jgi:hypothetical protein